MAKKRKSIAVVAPARPVTPEIRDQVETVASSLYGPERLSIAFHPQCFLTHGHFAGDDKTRSAAFLEAANDPDIDAVWFARGGYGSNRLLPSVFDSLNAAARAKTYLGYSDLGFVLARLYKDNIGKVAHGPMPADILRDGGKAAVERSLRWLAEGDTAGLEASVRPAAPVAAFNITVLSNLLGTPAAPDLSGHVLMLEDIDEYLYCLDRSLGHIMMQPDIQRAAGVMLGRVSDIIENDVAFSMTAQEMMLDWCTRIGVPFLGEADIGHDADNKIVIFGA